MKEEKDDNMEWIVMGGLLTGLFLVLVFYSGAPADYTVTPRITTTTTMPIPNSGVCTEVPDAEDCGLELDPVCADGITYTNLCSACSQGVYEWSKGKCPVGVVNWYGNTTYRRY